MRRKLPFVALLLAASLTLAADVPVDEQDHGTEPTEARPPAETQPKTGDAAKVISGMSILGNQEAPKSLVIVPWRSSVLGDSLGIAMMLDDSTEPVDKDVFMRALSYYEIRSETKP